MSLLRNHSLLFSKTAPTIPSGATNSFNSSTVTMTPARTPASGILLFACFSGVTARTESAAPSGWVEINSTPTGSGCIFHYYKIAGGSEPGTYSWTLSGSTQGQWFFTEVHNIVNTPYHAEEINSTTATSFSYSPFNIAAPSIAFASICLQSNVVPLNITAPYVKTTLNFRGEVAYGQYKVPRAAQVPIWTCASVVGMTRITIFRGLV